METFGEALRRRRMKAGLSLRALATEVGYSHVHIHQIEHGEKNITPEIARRCDEALGARGKLLALAKTSSRSRTPARTVRIPNELWEAARARASREGRTVSQLVNASLRSYLELPGRNARKRPNK